MSLSVPSIRSISYNTKNNSAKANRNISFASNPVGENSCTVLEKLIVPILGVVLGGIGLHVANNSPFHDFQSGTVNGVSLTVFTYSALTLLIRILTIGLSKITGNRED